MDNPVRMTKRCTRDLSMMTKQYSGIFTPELINGEINHWHVTFMGAKDTLYQGETFR